MDAVFQSIPLGQLKESPFNARKVFDRAQLEELTSSVRAKGILNPLLVRKNGTGYEILAGARRFRAATAAGLEAAPAIVRELDDKAAMELMVIDNLQRADLHPLEEAEGYRLLMQKAGYDVARIAERVGRSVNYVYDALKLLGLTKAAQQLFRDGQIQKGHAVILARLTPADQARAIGKPGEGPLLVGERVLWTPDQERRGPSDPLKPISVRELQAWVDENVRFDRDAVEPMLFPETAETLAATREVAEKIVPITHDHYVRPEAKVEGERTYGPQSWRRADGTGKAKACDRSVTGVIVVGPGRGEAFKVCIDKKGCDVHWGAEKRAAARRAKAVAAGGKTGEDRYELQRRKDEEERKRMDAERARWEKAGPAIYAALAERIKKMPSGPRGLLGQVLIGAVMPHGGLRGADSVPPGSSAEDLVRHAVFILLVRETREWMAWREFPKRAKAFGIDVRKILDEAVPVEASCRACGCTESKACPGGCGWAESPNPKTNKGLCTTCAKPAKKKAAKKRPA